MQALLTKVQNLRGKILQTQPIATNRAGTGPSGPGSHSGKRRYSKWFRMLLARSASKR
jgi:hypothetical protein